MHHIMRSCGWDLWFVTDACTAIKINEFTKWLKPGSLCYWHTLFISRVKEVDKLPMYPLGILFSVVFYNNICLPTLKQSNIKLCVVHRNTGVCSELRNWLCTIFNQLDFLCMKHPEWYAFKIFTSWSKLCNKVRLMHCQVGTLLTDYVSLLCCIYGCMEKKCIAETKQKEQ